MQMNELLLSVIFFLAVGLLFTLVPIYLYRLYLLVKKLKECNREEWNYYPQSIVILNGAGGRLQEVGFLQSDQARRAYRGRCRTA